MAYDLPAPLVELQDRVATLLGRDPASRTELVASMLRRERSEVAAYWLQLLVAASIATLGLALGSTAVIIGAMLIAPLMEPIVNLGMGLAVGSPFLVLRSIARVSASVVVVICGSAFVVWLLPFHELNAEIAARTSPTALDLFTAAFCALAGVYATLRSGSETATTAAGTSIGISLVPPLCASGYGVGTGTWPVAGGALLLFVTNFAAIIFVATLSFVAAGMNQIAVAQLEREALAQEGPAHLSRRIARRLERAFASGGGPLLRFAMPILLLGVLYFPLRTALDEVAWQVRVRGVVENELRGIQGRLVEKHLRVERGAVELLLVLIGTDEQVASVKAHLDGRIREAAGVAPVIEVHAVPDAATIAGLASALRSPVQSFVPPPPVVHPMDAWQSSAQAIQRAIDAHWPERSAGRPLDVEVSLEGAPLRIRVAHHGSPIGADAREVLERALSRALEREVRVSTEAIPVEPIRSEQPDLAFAAQVLPLLNRAHALEDLSVCVTERVPARRRPGPNAKSNAEDALRAIFSRYPRLSMVPGEAWSVRFTQGVCTSTSTASARREPPQEP